MHMHTPVSLMPAMNLQTHLFGHILNGVGRDFGRPVMLWQVGILIGLLVLAWPVAYGIRRALDRYREARTHDEALRFGARSLHRALFPLIGAALVWLVRSLVGSFMHTGLLDLALVPLVGIGLIYIVFFFMRRVFGHIQPMRAWLVLVEKLVSLVVWVSMILVVLGIQDDVLNWMGSVHFGIGTQRVTLLSLATGAIWVCVTLIVAIWAGAAFEDRVMRATSIDANLRVALSRVGRALLVLVAVMISLSLVGIDLTVLSVFGGALGVGLGFGLQKIASNYVSGFIILLDRSVRLGDTIDLGNGLQGKVTQIRTRYTVVRGLDSNETLIPNEKLITDVVQNQSSYLTRGAVKAAVQVACDTDLDEAMALLVQAATGVARVLADPAPTPYLASFGADGINLELGYWVADAASGTVAVRSTVNLNIWRLFKEHGISIPFTQREVRIIGVEGVQNLPVAMASTSTSTSTPASKGGRC
jgi:small-conductance mechanosensitive channel